MEDKAKSELTKKKLNLQTIGINTALIILGAVIVISFIAPYIHIILDKKSTIKYFGFRNLRSFLYAFGNPLSLAVCSSLLLFASKHIKSKLGIYYRIGAILFSYSSIFQFIWIFWSRNPDLPKSSYYISIASLSVVGMIIYYFFVRQYKSTLSKLKIAFSDWFNFTSETVPQVFVPPGKAEEYIKHHHNLIDKTDL